MKHKNRSLKGNSSVSKLCAQNTTVCDKVSLSLGQKSTLSVLVEELSEYNFPLYVFAKLQLDYGFRVSELLSIRWSDSDRLGRISVKGLKGSANRLIHLDANLLRMKADYFSSERIFYMFNRFMIYRMYKNKGIITHFATNKKASVTHSLRFESAKLLQESFTDLELTQSLLGHKSQLNTTRYVKKK